MERARIAAGVNVIQSPKLAFFLVVLLWVLLWVASGLAAGGTFGDSLPQLAFFLGMALVPPILVYGLLFSLLPWIWKKIRGTQI